MVVGVAPFVGRARERRALDAAVSDARSSRGSVVLLTGAAGIGKTRLADELTSTPEGAPEVVWSTCGPAGAMPPFWPWTQIIGELLRRDHAFAQGAHRAWPAATDLARSPADAAVALPRPPDPAQARADLFRDVVGLVAGAASRRPLLIVIDDLHDADTASWLLLAHLAVSIRSLPAAVVGTWRTGELRPIEPAATRLFRLADVLPVPPLAVEDVAVILEASHRRPIVESMAEAVHRRTSGNPLLTHEISTHLLAHDAIDDVAAVGRVIPDSIAALVAERLARTSPDCRDVLALAATLGTTFATDVLAEAADVGLTALLDVLGEAVAAGFLASLDARIGAFPHDVVRDAVVVALPGAKRAANHAQIGAALQRRRDRGLHVESSALAYHFSEAGPGPVGRVTAHFREAAEKAMAMLAYEDAAELYGRAVEAQGTSVHDAAARAELLAGLGEARDASGDRAGSRLAYLEAAAQARLAGRADLLGSAALGMSGGVGFEVALLDRDQIDLLREALQALPRHDVVLRASVMARLAVALVYLEEVEARADLSEEALRLARESGDERCLLQALAARCDAIAGPEHCATRRGLASEIVEVATRLRDPQLELLGRRLRVVALLELGDLRAVDREIEAFAATAAMLRRPLYSWYVPLWRAMRAEMEGRFDDCRAFLAQAEQIGAQAGSTNATVLVGVLRWCLSAELMRADEVAALLADAHLDRHPGVWPVVARGLCLAQIGDLDRALVLLDAAAARLPGVERDSEWLPMMAQLVELIGLLGPHPVAGWVYEALLEHRSLFVVEGIGAVVRGSVERDLGILAAALDRREEASAHFDAAIAAARALGGQRLIARTLRDSGVSLSDPARLRAARAHYETLGIAARVAEIDGLLGACESEPVGRSLFRLEGEVWHLVYAGGDVRLRDSKGLRDLARLLSAPAQPVAAVELAAAIADQRPRGVPDGLHSQGDLGEVLDVQARRAYRHRLAELDEEIEDADAAGDPWRSERAASEKDALVSQLAAAYGLGGRPRRAGDPAERARQTVSARIRDAICRIDAVHPNLGRHLRRSVRTGRVCVYEPDAPIDWSF